MSLFGEDDDEENAARTNDRDENDERQNFLPNWRYGKRRCDLNAEDDDGFDRPKRFQVRGNAANGRYNAQQQNFVSNRRNNSRRRDDDDALGHLRRIQGNTANGRCNGNVERQQFQSNWRNGDDDDTLYQPSASETSALMFEESDDSSVGTDGRNVQRREIEAREKAVLRARYLHENEVWEYEQNGEVFLFAILPGYRYKCLHDDCIMKSTSLSITTRFWNHVLCHVPHSNV